MDNLIELYEQKPSMICLTRAEGEELGRLQMDVRLKPDLDNDFKTPVKETDGAPFRTYEVNPGFQVGHFRLSGPLGRTVRVSPKVGIRNVFVLLGAAYSFYSARKECPFRAESVDYAIDKSQILEPLVRQFNASITQLLQDGLLSNYLKQEENLKVLRGRLSFSKHITQNLVKRDRLYCRFFQAEVDIPENQIILWALILANRAGDWAQDVRRTIHSHILHFGGVSLRQFLPRQSPVFHYDRLTSRYREAHDWARLLIDFLSISDKPGKTTCNGYLLNMNELFERFVISAFERAKESVPLVSVKDHKPHRLDMDDSVGIVPDLTLEGPSLSIVAVDAKYKRTMGNEKKAKHPDLYQVISYCLALGSVGQTAIPAQGILVYPVAEISADLNRLLRVITSRTPSSELSVRIVWIDLDSEDVVRSAKQTFTEILQEISSGARLSNSKETANK